MEAGDSRSIFILLDTSCNLALFDIANGQFKRAASLFIRGHGEVPGKKCVREKGMYALICALATFSIEEIKNDILESRSFKKVLRKEWDVRELLITFYRGDYKSFFTLLNKAKVQLYLDSNISSQVDALYLLIRKQALANFCRPFKSLYLCKVAATFSTSVENVENEIVALILEEKIQARIDSVNKILFAKPVDLQRENLNQVLEVVRNHQRIMRLLLLRVTMVENQLIVVEDSQRSR